MKNEHQQYRVNTCLRRRSESPLTLKRPELKSEDFDSMEEFCLAVASDLMDAINEDQEYLANKRG